MKSMTNNKSNTVENQYKMTAVSDVLEQELRDTIPFFTIRCRNVPISHITIRGSFNHEDTWINGLFLKSRGFMITVTPGDNQRYYKEGNKITSEIWTSNSLSATKFRKTTNTPEKVIDRLKAWILENKEIVNNIEKQDDTIY
jgi:hypothetical protein